MPKGEKLVNKLYIVVVVSCLAIGCTQGQWIKEGADPQTVENDFRECQTVGTSFEPAPATLGDKIGANPDMSGQAIEKCMQAKGYRWGTPDPGERPEKKY